MKLDNALNIFMEKYDREAIGSLDELSEDFGMKVKGIKIKAFNINESFKKFDNYIRGYKDYKIKNVNNDKSSSQDVIRESVANVINTQLFTECEIPYSEIPAFVSGYISGVKMLTETANEIREELLLNDITGESVSDIDLFMDQFMDKLSESFDPTMDRFLWASGYNSQQRLKPKTEKAAKPMFL